MKIVGIIVSILVGLISIALIAQRLADGPSGPFPGGELRTGNLVTESEIDWSFADSEDIELQLVNPVSSRTTGAMVHDGELYIPCDLGFMWGRFSGQQRLILHTIYVFKRWHEDAVRDGRVVIRIGGSLYERQAVRVTDPELIATLRSQLEDMARAWIAPATLGPPPSEGPRDIWFFRVDPRPAALRSSA